MEIGTIMIVIVRINTIFLYLDTHNNNTSNSAMFFEKCIKRNQKHKSADDAKMVNNNLPITAFENNNCFQRENIPCFISRGKLINYQRIRVNVSPLTLWTTTNNRIKARRAYSQQPYRITNNNSSPFPSAPESRQI